VKPEDSALTIFNNALELPDPAARASYLNEACGTDTALLGRVAKLLRAHGEAGGFFSQPMKPITMEQVGAVIGRYKLLEQIGEGGCGVVYMAEQQEPVRRRVALKVIKLGMDTKQVVARFEAERQALALMDHPNIARVLDAGATDTGRPYFVMELVRGIKITEFCDQKQFSTPERLELFISVCRAIQHAHQKGIIHRDLKPSNVLVTIVDGAPVAKVIDFGIAKATSNQPLTDKTLFTAFAQFVGTPAYMSPEQAEMSGVDIDTRTDVYSLGVMLYELLTGKTPFDAEELLHSGIDEIRRTIREQEPPKPSTRLHALSEVDLTTTAQARHVDGHKLVQTIKGDLDWIVMKCLEKERGRRYETVNGLAADILRHLNTEPVMARPPSRWYEFQKTVRRHKLGFAAAAALIVVMALGVLGSTLQALRATRAEREQSRLRQQAQADQKKAETEAAKSQQVATFLQDMLKGVGPSAALGRDTTMLREILDKTAERVGRDFTNQPEVEVELRAILARTYEELGLFKQREEMARATLEVSRERLGEQHPAVAEALHQIGDARSRLGDQATAELFMREAVTLRQKILGSEHPSTAASLNVLAWVVMRRNNLIEAEKLGREALAIRQKCFGDEHQDVADSIYFLASVIGAQGRLVEAENLHREALAMEKKVLGEDHPAVAESLNNLAVVLHGAGKLAESENMHREALARRRKLFGDGHPDVGDSVKNLASVLYAQGKLTEAEALIEEEIKSPKNPFATYPRLAADLAELQSDTQMRRGNWAEAALLARQALSSARELEPRSLPSRERRVEKLANIFHSQKKYAEAEPLYREVLDSRRARLPSEDERVLVTTVTLARFLSDWAWTDYTDGSKSASSHEHAVEAERLLRDCMAIRSKAINSTPWRVADLKRCLGAAIVAVAISDPALSSDARLRKFSDAEPMMLEADHALQQSSKPDATVKRDSIERLMRLYEAWDREAPNTGNSANAREWRKKLEEFRTKEPDAAKSE
jgi:eukaryotic-like serine/threonine-protein kinase